MPYTVYYITEAPNSEYNGEVKSVEINGTTYYHLVAQKNKTDNTHTVVTENYVHVEGYLPKDKVYQQVLILSHDTAKNVIIFVYEENANSTSYIVTHYFEDANGTYTWTNGDQETKKYRAGIQDTRPALVGDQVTVTYNSISGYKSAGSNYVYGNTTSDPYYSAYTETVVIRENAGTLHFHLYYDEVTALFTYYAIGQGSVSQGNETVKVISGMPVGSVPTAADGYKFDGWYLDAACETPVGTVGTVDPDSNKLVPNKTAYYSRYELEKDTAQVSGYASDTFYAKFVEENVKINYKIVDPAGNVYDTNQTCGTLTSFSEEVLAVTGGVVGSTAAPTSNVYKFIGWYDNVGCEGEPLSKDATYVPTKDDDSVWPATTTYYAKFEYNVSDLIVKKTGMHAGESAVVRVVITNGDDVDEYTIVLNADVDHDKDGTPSVIIKDVLIGSTYTVSELDAWTWRYDNNEPVTYAATPDSERNYKIVADVAKNTVTVTNSKNTYQWLSDESAVENNLSTGTGTGYNND